LHQAPPFLTQEVQLVSQTTSGKPTRATPASHMVSTVFETFAKTHVQNKRAKTNKRDFIFFRFVFPVGGPRYGVSLGLWFSVCFSLFIFSLLFPPLLLQSALFFFCCFLVPD